MSTVSIDVHQEDYSKNTQMKKMGNKFIRERERKIGKTYQGAYKKIDKRLTIEDMGVMLSNHRLSKGVFNIDPTNKEHMSKIRSRYNEIVRRGEGLSAYGMPIDREDRYKDATISDYFSFWNVAGLYNFALYMFYCCENFKLELDKDVLFPRSKMYCPFKTLWLPKKENILITDKSSTNGLPLCVTKVEHKGDWAYTVRTEVYGASDTRSQMEYNNNYYEHTFCGMAAAFDEVIQNKLTYVVWKIQRWDTPEWRAKLLFDKMKDVLREDCEKFRFPTERLDTVTYEELEYKLLKSQARARKQLMLELENYEFYRMLDFMKMLES